MSLTLPEIAAYVAEDLAARSVVAEVQYGDWNVDKHGGADVVIFGLGDGDIQGPAPTNAPGFVQYEQDGEQLGAAALAEIVQRIQVWVHAAPPADSSLEEWACAAQVKTMFLLKATIAALSRCTTCSFGMVSGSLKWPRPEQTQFTYGALAMFQISVRIPVLDDVYVHVVDDVGNSVSTVTFG